MVEDINTGSAAPDKIIDEKVTGSTMISTMAKDLNNDEGNPQASPIMIKNVSVPMEHT